MPYITRWESFQNRNPPIISADEVKLFQQLLVLGESWRVKSVDYVEQESKVVIRIEETPQLWASQKCPHCEAASVAGYDHAPEIFRFVEPKVFQQAVRTFGAEGAPTKILVVPALPQAEDARRQSIELLRSKGIDAVIPFHVMLADLVGHIEVNRNYQKSDLLR